MMHQWHVASSIHVYRKGKRDRERKWGLAYAATCHNNADVMKIMTSSTLISEVGNRCHIIQANIKLPLRFLAVKLRRHGRHHVSLFLESPQTIEFLKESMHL